LRWDTAAIRELSKRELSRIVPRINNYNRQLQLKSGFVTWATQLSLVNARGLTLCLTFLSRSFHTLGHHSALHYTLMCTPFHLAGCCRIVPRPRPRRTYSPDAAQPLHLSCLFNACSHRQNPCRALLLTTLVNLAHAGTEPGLDEAFDPVCLPGDWWIRTLPRGSGPVWYE